MMTEEGEGGRTTKRTVNTEELKEEASVETKRKTQRHAQPLPHSCLFKLSSESGFLQVHV